VSRSKLFATGLSAIAIAGIAVPSMATAKAKSYKVTMKVTKAVPQKGTTIGAVYGGSPFGTCTMTGKLILPKSLQVWKCKGGTFHVTAVGTSGASNDAKGNWTLSKGTGKYKGISGKGTFAGQISTGLFSYTGSAKF
jgi:hypothetical protein